MHKHSGMACVNKGSDNFTCHPHVYPQVAEITKLSITVLTGPDKQQLHSYAWHHYCHNDIIATKPNHPVCYPVSSIKAL